MLRGMMLLLVAGCSGRLEATPQPRQGWNELTPQARQVIEKGGTERAFTGKFLNHKEAGTYTCARCSAPLFPSGAKFKSGTGWPSFDQALPGAVKEVPDGLRVEIRCARCDGHLGHVFRGEGMTQKNTRHCVNSVALGFSDTATQEAFFAGGCFWGVEHLLEAMPGVLSVQSGYMGGNASNPTYKQVVRGRTGHAETVRVVYDPKVISYERLARQFFEIHDPTQVNRQGPDIGTHYRSAVFVTNSEQEQTTLRLIGELKRLGFKVATQVEPAEVFWPAEDYHQDYYKKTGKAPYCHSYTPRFKD